MPTRDTVQLDRLCLVQVLCEAAEVAHIAATQKQLLPASWHTESRTWCMLLSELTEILLDTAESQPPQTFAQLRDSLGGVVAAFKVSLMGESAGKAGHKLYRAHKRAEAAAYALGVLSQLRATTQEASGNSVLPPMGSSTDGDGRAVEGDDILREIHDKRFDITPPLLTAVLAAITAAPPDLLLAARGLQPTEGWRVRQQYRVRSLLAACVDVDALHAGKDLSLRAAARLLTAWAQLPQPNTQAASTPALALGSGSAAAGAAAAHVPASRRSAPATQPAAPTSIKSFSAQPLHHDVRIWLSAVVCEQAGEVVRQAKRAAARRQSQGPIGLQLRVGRHVLPSPGQSAAGAESMSSEHVLARMGGSASDLVQLVRAVQVLQLRAAKELAGAVQQLQLALPGVQSITGSAARSGAAGSTSLQHQTAREPSRDRSHVTEPELSQHRRL